MADESTFGALVTRLWHTHSNYSQIIHCWFWSFHEICWQINLRLTGEFMFSQTHKVVMMQKSPVVLWKAWPPRSLCCVISRCVLFSSCGMSFLLVWLHFNIWSRHRFFSRSGKRKALKLNFANPPIKPTTRFTLNTAGPPFQNPHMWVNLQKSVQGWFV